jgi:hypothetical protein
MAAVQCSRAGKWIFDEYAPYVEGDPTCDTVRLEIPMAVLWDTAEGKYHTIGRGYWDVRWAPDESYLVYRFQRHVTVWNETVASGFGCPQRSRMSAPSCCARSCVRRWDRTADGTPTTSSGRSDGSVPTAFWSNWPRRILGGTRGARTGHCSRAPERRCRHCGRAAESGDFRSSARLALPQLNEDDSEDILDAAGCGREGLDDEEQSLRCITPALLQQDIRIDLDRYCAGLTAGDVEAFCKKGHQA